MPPVRAVTVLAASPAAEPGGGLAPAVITTAAVGAAFVAVVVCLAYLARRRRSAAPPSASESARASHRQRSLQQLEAATRNRLLAADQQLHDATGTLDALEAEALGPVDAGFRASLHAAAGGVAAAHRRILELDQDVPEDDPQRREILEAVSALCEQSMRQLTRHREDVDARRLLLRTGGPLVDAIAHRIDAARERLRPARAALDELAEHFPPVVTEPLAVVPEQARILLDDADLELSEARSRFQASIITRGGAPDRLLHATALVARAEALLDSVDHTIADLAAARAALAALMAEVQGQLDAAVTWLLSGELAAATATATGDHTAARLRSARSEAAAQLAHAERHAQTDPMTTYRALAVSGLELDAALAAAAATVISPSDAPADPERPGPVGAAVRVPQAIRSQLLFATARVRAAETFVAGHGFHVGQRARTRLAQSRETLQEAYYCDPRLAADIAALAADHAEAALAQAQDDIAGEEEFRRAVDRRRHPSVRRTGGTSISEGPSGYLRDDSE